MKKILLTICLILMCGTVYAAAPVVKGKILKKDIDANGNIIFYTNYTIDGVDMPSKYPKIDGKTNMVTRASYTNFVGMTDEQIEARILSKVQEYVDAVVGREYAKKKNLEILEGNLSTIIGKEVTASSTEKLVDTTGDGELDTKWTLRADGTRDEEVYTAPIK